MANYFIFGKHQFLLILATTALLFAQSSATTLSACGQCVLKIPQALICGGLSDECSWDSCLNTDENSTTGFDFDACDTGCVTCFDQVLTCFDECTPDCLNTTVNEYYNCVVSSPWKDCAGPCYDEFKDVNITDSLEGAFDGVLEPPTCSLDSLTSGGGIFNGGVDCLFPSWPACPTVQENIVQPTCDATSCCSTCHGELAAMETCVYNWMAGESCDFTCAANRFLNEHILAPALAVKDDQEHADSAPRLLDTLAQPEFEEECRIQLSRDAVTDPLNAVNKFVTCITSNTIEEATTEEARLANAGDDDDTGDDDDDDDGNTSLAAFRKSEIWACLALISAFVFAL